MAELGDDHRKKRVEVNKQNNMRYESAITVGSVHALLAHKNSHE